MAVSEVKLRHDSNMKFMSEENERITSAFHVQQESFLNHVEMEGLSGYQDERQGDFESGQVTTSGGKCDRLLKIENQYLKIQLGYHPGKKRTFLISNTKTSRFDTIVSRQQKEIDQKSLEQMIDRKQKAQVAYGKKFGDSKVILHMRQAQPWMKRGIESFLQYSEDDAVRTAMPFFAINVDYRRRGEIKEELKIYRDMISENARSGNRDSNSEIYENSLDLLQQENYLQALITRKETARNYFLNRINYAIDWQKQDMFAYYKDKMNQDKEKEMDSSEDEKPDEEQ